MSPIAILWAVLRRLLGLALAMLVLITLSFFLMRAVPGGPFDRERSLPPEAEAALRAEYRLDAPMPQQLADYLRGLLRGDLGPSFSQPGKRVNALIAQGAPTSARLGAMALLLALTLGLLGAWQIAQKPQGLRARGLRTAALLGLSLPNYLTAPLMILLFAVTLHWLPAGGWRTGAWQDMVLPVLALALPLSAAVLRIASKRWLEVRASGYYLTALAKGIPPAKALWLHGWRPLALPLLAWLGPATAAVLTGSVAVEQIFGIPGIGRYFVQGALNRDYSLVMGVVLLYGGGLLVANALVDAAQWVVDPHLRQTHAR